MTGVDNPDEAVDPVVATVEVLVEAEAIAGLIMIARRVARRKTRTRINFSLPSNDPQQIMHSFYDVCGYYRGGCENELSSTHKIWQRPFVTLPTVDASDKENKLQQQQ
jgi:hypothetical protein